ncbi:MAG: single-stranded-DNA-specific exonuclease RecJ [Anaerolineae bacterium]|nr:single-stranded-DNA-specific exonuclease RecJ [Anaerolineae bacterium]
MFSSFSTQWIIPQRIDVPDDLSSMLGGDDLLEQALLRRNISSSGQARVFLDPLQYQPADASQMPDLDKAAERICSAIHKKQKIGIWGDFDVDGQTSTTLLVSALKYIGADVEYHIPIRATESHGITLPVLKQFLSRGIQLLITCDTGITAFDAALECLSRDVDMIITDHHTLAETLPNAYAVVNPQRSEEGHALSYLCGVGCAYKVIEGVYQRLNHHSELSKFLDLVAMGTVADVALLLQDNRFLVQQGLRLIQTSPRPALRSIFKLTDTNHARLTEEHIGFTLAPRLNAIGRLADANPVVPFLMSGSEEAAQDFSLELEKFNDERKLLCDQVFKAAQHQIELDRSLLNDPVLILSQPNWPTGVVGIVASRLVDLYHRPCILINATPGGVARGSARSVDGFHITRAIASQKDLLLGYGGHPMAAGLSLTTDNLPLFRKGLSRYAEKTGFLLNQVAKLNIDAFVNLQDLSLPFVEKLSLLAPFGAGNPSFTLASRNLFIKNKTVIGKNKEHLKIVVEDQSGNASEVLWWQGAGVTLPEGKFDLAFSARTSDFRGYNQVQLEWVDAHAVTAEPINIFSPLDKYEILDWRLTPPGVGMFDSFATQEPCIWAEGRVSTPYPAFDRFNLHPSPILIIWNAPPGVLELKQVLLTVKPQKIVLLDNASDQITLNDFIKEITGLVRYALREKQGFLDLNVMASMTAQRKISVALAIDWLCVKGFIRKTNSENQDLLQVTQPGDVSSASTRLESELKMILNETGAYRQFYRQAQPENIISAALRFEG